MSALHETAPAINPLPGIAGAIPVLKTVRLTLRAPELGDFPVLLEIDESVADTSPRGPRDRATSWNDFTQMTATWVWRGHGWWTVADPEGPCGFVGLGFEPGDREPELGYLFATSARGKGYATEACIAARDFARDILKLPGLVSYISDANAASRNVAGKLGARRDPVAEATLREDGVQVWRHWGGEA